MAKIPKTAEFWTLKSGVGEADLQITAVNMVNTYDGHSMVHIEGVPIRQRMGMNTGSTTSPGYASTPIRPNTGSITGITFDGGQIGIEYAKNDLMKGKGMAVQIKTIETVDGHKAQIVLSVGTKSVIAWESDAFEDDADLEKGQTGEVKAKNAAESHAKDVLKRTFQ